MKIYSGGLGILAGDYLKEASDKGTKITAVGLLYRYGYFTQKLSAMGDQEAEYEAQDFMKIAVTPVRDKEVIGKPSVWYSRDGMYMPGSGGSMSAG